MNVESILELQGDVIAWLNWSDLLRANARTMLAIAFPPANGLPGATADIADVSRLNPLLTTRRNAARLVMLRNNTRRAPGHGNRAFRRALALCK